MLWVSWREEPQITAQQDMPRLLLQEELTVRSRGIAQSAVAVGYVKGCDAGVWGESIGGRLVGMHMCAVDR